MRSTSRVNGPFKKQFSLSAKVFRDLGLYVWLQSCLEVRVLLVFPIPILLTPPMTTGDARRGLGLLSSFSILRCYHGNQVPLGRSI